MTFTTIHLIKTNSHDDDDYDEQLFLQQHCSRVSIKLHYCCHLRLT